MRVSIIVGLLMFVVFADLIVGQACSEAPNSFKTQSSNGSLDAGLAVQKPVMDCTVTNSANGTFIEHITDLTSSTTYPLNSPTAPLAVKIDCSKSSSPVGASLSFSYSQDGVISSQTGSIANMSFPNPKLSALKITIKDSKGAVNDKPFNFPVACNPAAYPALTVNANALSITAGSQVGYMNINFAGVASGGTGNYSYSLDLNGDGRFDNYNKTLYSSVSAFSNMYTLDSGSRSVGIRVLDASCQYMASASKTVNFANLLPAAESGAMATEKAYYYVQGIIEPLNAANTDAADKVLPFQAVEAPPTSGPRLHVDCSYNKNSMGGAGDFAIKGLNAYDDGSVAGGVNPALIHGMTLHVTNISDNGSAGTQTAAATMADATYRSPASLDGGLKQYNFAMKSACSVNVSIKRATSVAPCASGTGVNSPAVTILGTYSCPDLHANAAAGDDSSAGKDITINNGYFYCQYAPSDGCVGGGQGGGGQPPPVF